VRINKLGGTVYNDDLIASKLVADDFRFALHHRAHTEHQVLHGNVCLYYIVLAVEAALAETGELQDRFTKGLAGNGAGMHADTADLSGRGRPIT
jgi:hypothetical protein